MNQAISFSVTGDSLTVKRLCRNSLPLLKIRKLLMAADISFTNLEASIHRYEPDIYASLTSGGDWVAASPDVLQDLQWFGFNLFASPNNHSMDWCHGGLVRTIENMEQSGAVFGGIGRNLADACAPAYLETPGGRVALIACNTTYEPWHIAGEQRRDLQGRPGIFAVQFDRIHQISREELTVLERLHQKTMHENDGWKEIDGARLFSFGERLYQEGAEGEITKVRKHSLETLKRSIHEARRQADLVLVSVHSHERSGPDPHTPAGFQTELAHFCIDQGANVFAAHGPHVLRGIELYRGCPIFHGLGNFFYQCELLPKAPSEFYSKFASFGSRSCTADVYDYRVGNGGILGETNEDYFRTVLASFTMKNKRLDKMVVHPVTLQFSAHRASKGTPALAHGPEADIILRQLQELSLPYGTQFTLHTDCAKLAAY